MSTSWFVRRGSKIHGPLDSHQLKQLASTGKIGVDSEVARSAVGPWVPARRVRGLFVAEDAKPQSAAGVDVVASDASGDGQSRSGEKPSIAWAQILQAGVAAADTYRKELGTTVLPSLAAAPPAAHAPPAPPEQPEAVPSEPDVVRMGFWQWYRHTYREAGFFLRFLLLYLFFGWLWIPWQWMGSKNAAPYAKKAGGMWTAALLAVGLADVGRRERLEGYIVGEKVTGMHEEYRFAERDGRINLNELEKKNVYDKEYTVRVLTDEDKAKSLAMERTSLLVAAALVVAIFFVSRPNKTSRA